MVQLTEELILEILSFLPLESLVQRKYLNKSLMQSISDPAFQYRYALRSGRIGFECLLHRDSLFSILTIELPSHRHSHRDGNSYSSSIHPYNHFSVPIVLASSGGLLLLWLNRNNGWYCHCPRTFCIFNPVTGAYRFIPYLKSRFIGIGLAVEVRSKNLSSYKFVAILKKDDDVNYHRFMIFESESWNWRLSSAELRPDKNLLVSRVHEEGFSLNGSMYWLTDDGLKVDEKGEILAFNLKTEVAEIINKPEDCGDLIIGRTGFGAIGDKLAVVTVQNDSKILLYLYDPTNCSWKIDRIFEGYIIPFHENWDLVSAPLFYDGNRLILVSTSNAEGCIEGITVDSVEKIFSAPMPRHHWLKFQHFSATLTDISHCQYLVNGSNAMKYKIPDDPGNADSIDCYFSDLLFIQVMLNSLKEFEKKLGIKITCSEETEPLGTAGPLEMEKGIIV